MRWQEAEISGIFCGFVKKVRGRQRQSLTGGLRVHDCVDEIEGSLRRRSLRHFGLNPAQPEFKLRIAENWPDVIWILGIEKKTSMFMFSSLSNKEFYPKILGYFCFLSWHYSLMIIHS
jgi:hypothetical protein